MAAAVGSRRCPAGGAGRSRPGPFSTERQGQRAPRPR
jgi:hypothetical protein